MSCNSCNRNSTQNNSMNARSNQMYRSTQLSRSGYMNRTHNQTRGATGRMMSRNYQETSNCDCAENMNQGTKCVESNNCNENCRENKSNNSDCADKNNQIFGCNMDSCNQATDPVDSMMVAMAYVPWQQWGEIYDFEKALRCGTIFDDLNKPWIGRACE